jgi:hypothetical protein
MIVVDPDPRGVQRVDRTNGTWSTVWLGHSHPSLISSRDDNSDPRVRLAEHSEPNRGFPVRSTRKRWSSDRLDDRSALGKYWEWERGEGQPPHPLIGSQQIRHAWVPTRKE